MLIRAGRVERIGVDLPTPADNTREWDLAGRVLLPGLVDLHTHLDKTYSTLENQSGTLLETIAVWGRFKQQRTPKELANVVRRACARPLPTASPPCARTLTLAKSAICSRWRHC
ncbi:MAG: amidohydrolase family protein [Caldilineaceae bacterium]